MKQYKRLTQAEREEISRGIASSLSYREIGNILGRNCSTIIREIERNSINKNKYRAVVSQKLANKRARIPRRKRKLRTNKKLERFIVKYLNKCWSPEQIVNRLKMLYPRDTNMRVSYETIYGYIYVHPRHNLKRELLKYLRRAHKFRRVKNKTRMKSCPIKDFISIDDRPKEVETRKIAGHWEGDLLMGKMNGSAIGTLVERKTRLTLLTKLRKRDTSSVNSAFARKFNKLPRSLKRSLTYDHGQEMAGHAKFTEKTKIKVYFAHPHSPWERGTSENTNALLRQFFPRGIDFTKVSWVKLKRAENLLNDRPRKTLNWYTPREVFTGKTDVALET